MDNQEIFKNHICVGNLLLPLSIQYKIENDLHIHALRNHKSRKWNWPIYDILLYYFKSYYGTDKPSYIVKLNENNVYIMHDIYTPFPGIIHPTNDNTCLELTGQSFKNPVDYRFKRLAQKNNANFYMKNGKPYTYSNNIKMEKPTNQIIISNDWRVLKIDNYLTKHHIPRNTYFYQNRIYYFSVYIVSRIKHILIPLQPIDLPEFINDVSYKYSAVKILVKPTEIVILHAQPGVFMREGYFYFELPALPGNDEFKTKTGDYLGAQHYAITFREPRTKDKMLKISSYIIKYFNNLDLKLQSNYTTIKFSSAHKTDYVPIGKNNIAIFRQSLQETADLSMQEMPFLYISKKNIKYSPMPELFLENHWP